MNKLTIDSDISYWGYSARWMSSKLSEMSGELEVDISSYGGDVFEGIDMFNQLRRYSREKGHVTTIVGSKAMSIASLLMLAGDTRKAHSNSTVMIHKAWTWLAGNSDELIAESKVLNGIDAIMAKQYAKHMNISQEEILKVMSSEGWYVGKEQIAGTNFIDSFIDEENGVEVSAKANYRKAMSRFSAKAQEDNVKPNFDEVKASIMECNDGKCPSANIGSTFVPTASVSESLISDNSTEIKTGADMKFDGTEEQFNALMANKQTLASRNDTLKLNLQTANTALEAKGDELTQLVASHTVELSEAAGKLDSFKAETTTRLQEASTSKVSIAVALEMVNADSKEDASKLALEASESNSATFQGDNNKPDSPWAGRFNNK